MMTRESSIWPASAGHGLYPISSRGSIIIRSPNPVKKEMRKEVETSKNMGIRSGRR